MHPKTIGPYRIDLEVGAGGLGKVYRAVDEENGNVNCRKSLARKVSKK